MEFPCNIARNCVVVYVLALTILNLNAADLPIARKNSLHRFLEKRKDRYGLINLSKFWILGYIP